MLITWYLSLLLFCSGTADERVEAARKPASPGRRVVRSIPVDVIAPPEVSESFVRQICAEAEAVWGPAGMTFDCRRVTSGDAAHPGHLTVTIETRRSDPSEGKTTLGWIKFIDGRPEPSVHLSRATAEDLLRHAGSIGGPAIDIPEVLIERALGRALSHELGHYLLGSKAHAPRGLMRANWSSREVFALRRDGFELSAEERETAVRRLRHEGGPHRLTNSVPAKVTIQSPDVRNAGS